MRKFMQVTLFVAAVAVMSVVLLASAHAGMWLVNVATTPTVCAPVACAPVMCAPAICVATPCVAAPCVCAPVKPSNRISFWTGPARPCGEPTYHEYNTQTGQFNQIIDVGLNASGQSAIQLSNSSGGWTILKAKKD